MTVVYNAPGNRVGQVHNNVETVDAKVSAKQVFMYTAFTAAVSTVTAKLIDLAADSLRRRNNPEEDKEMVRALDSPDLTVLMSRDLVKRMSNEVDETAKCEETEDKPVEE